MKRIIFMRHAKTEGWHEGIDDHGRALLERGHSDAVRMGQALVAAGWTPDHVLVSTARRARETWRGLGGVFEEAQPTYFEELYLASPETLEEVLSSQTVTGTLMIIGHNPGLHELACALARQAGSRDEFAIARIFEKFPTGCAALYEAEEDAEYQPTQFKLVDVIRPKELRADLT